MIFILVCFGLRPVNVDEYYVPVLCTTVCSTACVETQVQPEHAVLEAAARCSKLNKCYPGHF